MGSRMVLHILLGLDLGLYVGLGVYARSTHPHSGLCPAAVLEPMNEIFLK